MKNENPKGGYLRVLGLCHLLPFHLLLLLFPTITQAAADGPAFTTTRSRCTAEGACVKSPHYPDDYDRFDDCVIDVEKDGVLDVEAFDLEDGYDFLTVNGANYTGTNGPDGVAVKAGDEMEFKSDQNGQSSGFNI